MRQLYTLLVLFPTAHYSFSHSVPLSCVFKGGPVRHRTYHIQSRKSVGNQDTKWATLAEGQRVAHHHLFFSWRRTTILRIHHKVSHYPVVRKNSTSAGVRQSQRSRTWDAYDSKASESEILTTEIPMTNVSGGQAQQEKRRKRQTAEKISLWSVGCSSTVNVKGRSRQCSKEECRHVMFL